ncbi:MAG TPA: putative porin [Burkholderiaceae bacterium]|nr:putative porin [Burkholderiaceae bacterium]
MTTLTQNVTATIPTNTHTNIHANTHAKLPTAVPANAVTNTTSPGRGAAPLGALELLVVALATSLASPWAAAQTSAAAGNANANANATPTSATAANDDRAGLQELRATTLALIEALVEQGLLPRAKADELIRKAREAGQSAASSGKTVALAAPVQWGDRPPSPVVRVPYLPDTVKAQMKEEIKNDVIATARDENWIDARALPAWVKGIKIEGDVRVRAEAAFLPDDNTIPELYQLQNLVGATPAWSPDLVDTRVDRQRLTLRARLGVVAKPSDDVTAGIRITSGGTTPAASETITLGNDFQRSVVTLDRAYIRWEPGHDLRFEAGRMAVPFFGTDLLWPDDLAVEGVAAHGELNLASGLYAFSTLGAFPLQEFAISGDDKWLYGGQVGMDWAINGDWGLRGAVGYYNFKNIEGTRETELPPTGPFANTTPYQLSQYPATVRQKGNTLIDLNSPNSTAPNAVWGLASRFKPWDLTLALVDRQFAPLELRGSIDYVHNSGFDRADIVRRFGPDAPPELATLGAMITGWQARMDVGHGHMEDKGDWNTFIGWRRFERDAWPDAFTDTTWNLGGTNYKGYTVGGAYEIDHDTNVGLRWTSTSNLDDGTHGADLSSAKLHIDVLQVETNVKF